MQIFGVMSASKKAGRSTVTAMLAHGFLAMHKRVYVVKAKELRDRPRAMSLSTWRKTMVNGGVPPQSFRAEECDNGWNFDDRDMRKSW